MRTKHFRIAIVLVMGLVPLAGCAATAEPAEDNLDTAVENVSICLAAAELTKANKPQDAIDLIDAARAPAIQALEGREPLSDEMSALLDACADERRAAVLAISNGNVPPAEPKTPPKIAGDSWADALKAWVLPLAGLALFVSVLFLSLIVVARFLALTPTLRDRMSHQAAQRVRFWIGLPAMFVGSLGLAVGIAGLGKSTALPLSALICISAGAAMALVGTILFAAFLANRLRLSVEVHDKTGAKNDWSTARVVALLSILGARPPRGLEVPDGADVEALKGAALPDSPAGKVFDAIKTIILFLLAGTPWRIIVRTGPDGDLGTVTLVRNGAKYLERTVDVTSYTLPGDTKGERILHVLAAAIVMMGLRDRHDGFEGLIGTENWESLALTHLALNDYRSDEVTSLSLLDRAVALDSGNHVAAIAREHARWRTSDDLGELVEYAGWLADEADELASLRMNATPTQLPMVGEATP